ncbi:MAG: hypothetical protein J1E36_02275 [Eubacterium sp.]|nr:hypothetical protein [Eubacterium sp.]
MKKIKLLTIIISVAVLLTACSSQPTAKIDTNNWNTNYKFVFVHGLSGWGSYDSQYKFMPYWGMFGGDLMKYLNEQGYECYAASVAPTDSAWDRACELYAQLTGNIVDYGKEHSKRCNHERFGEDFSENPLIDEWDAENKINILGHSFGGATVRLFAELMANGSEAERNATDEDDISDFFTGGKADWIYSLTTLAAPHNGTSAYNIDADAVEPEGFKDRVQTSLSKMISIASKENDDGRIADDSASYDMYIDNALELNENIETLENVYYFSIPCTATIRADDGTYYPDESKMEVLYVKSSKLMGSYTGVTENGFAVDESWQENDGLVNTISARAPFGAPQKEYDENNVTTGEWNIMPTYNGDHMSLQGGMTKKNDVREYYVNFLDMINSL